MSWEFKRDFLKLDDSWESKVSLLLAILSVIMFIIWAVHVKDYFVMGYKDGIKECFMSQEFFVEMTDKGRELYSGTKINTNMTFEDMANILEYMENYTKKHNPNIGGGRLRPQDF